MTKKHEQNYLNVFLFISPGFVKKIGIDERAVFFKYRLLHELNSKRKDLILGKRKLTRTKCVLAKCSL